MPDQYLAVNDFLAYDKQLMGKLGRIGDHVAEIREQINHLDATFTAYRAETDTFRIQVNHQLADLRHELRDVKQSVAQGFAALFAHLGIKQPH